jgi:hypothetical protein
MWHVTISGTKEEAKAQIGEQLQGVEQGAREAAQNAAFAAIDATPGQRVTGTIKGVVEAKGSGFVKCDLRGAL